MTSGSSNKAPLPEIYAGLGRLRVTTTDIEALLARLYKSVPPEDVMLHAGRPLDSPDDLRTLTDTELRNLSISVDGKPPVVDALVVNLRLDEASEHTRRPTGSDSGKIRRSTVGSSVDFAHRNKNWAGTGAPVTVVRPPDTLPRRTS